MSACVPYRLHIGTGYEEPGRYECDAAITSRGYACKKCLARCYRRGWDKWLVDADNKRLVAERRATG